jgi:Uma2 family endonuclease
MALPRIPQLSDFPPDMSMDEKLLAVLHWLPTPDKFRVELIDGEIIVTPPALGGHEQNVSKVLTQFARNCDDIDIMGGLGLITPRGNVVPDLTVTTADAYGEDEEWFTPEHVLLVAEVSSKSTQHRDVNAKRHGYAGAGIPLYLMIDRKARTITLHSEPKGDRYLVVKTYPFGYKIPLPAPFDFVLDTSKLR